MFADVGPNTHSVLYRSVSPWEMASILETQRIVGRCASFSDDPRCATGCHTWFATTIAPIIHSGEDYLRYASTLPIWAPIHAALDRLSTISGDAYHRLEAQRAAHVWPVDRHLYNTYSTTNDLRRKLGDAYRKAIYELAKQAHTSGAKLRATSYVITVADVAGGIMYTGRDSMQGNAIEVCFPESAGPALYAHIQGVDLIKGRGRETPEIVGHLFADELDQLRVKLPTVRKTTVQSALNVYNRLLPKLAPWLDLNA